MSLNSKITATVLKYYQDTYGIKSRNSTQKTAPFFGCSEYSLRKSRMTGSLFGVPAPRHVKIGYTVQYTLEDIVKWLEKNSKNESEAA